MDVPPRLITATRLLRARGDETTRVRRARMRGTKRGRHRSLLVAGVMAAADGGSRRGSAIEQEGENGEAAEHQELTRSRLEGSARLKVVGGDSTVMPELGRLRGRRP
jgi:hypothetical protein